MKDELLLKILEELRNINLTLSKIQSTLNENNLPKSQSNVRQDIKNKIAKAKSEAESKLKSVEL